MAFPYDSDTPTEVLNVSPANPASDRISPRHDRRDRSPQEHGEPPQCPDSLWNRIRVLAGPPRAQMTRTWDTAENWRLIQERIAQAGDLEPTNPRLSQITTVQ